MSTPDDGDVNAWWKDRIAEWRAELPEVTEPLVIEAALPPLVAHGPSLWVLDGLSYLNVQPRTAPAELERLNPGLSCRVPTKDGEGVRWMSSTELHEAHGVTARELVWSCAATRPTWDAKARELVIPAGRYRDGRAAFSERCAAWLRDAMGDREGRVLDWVAGLNRQDITCAALVLRGPKGLGKGMLAAAVSRLFGGFVSYDEALGTFNGRLASTPFVWLDERAAKGGGSEAFRRLLGNLEHRLRALYQPHQLLRGAVRMLATTNHPDPFRLGEVDLTLDDDDAIGGRLILVDVRPAARAHLGAVTDGWCDTDGELVAHLRWVVNTREVTRGERFWVDGDAEDYGRRIGARTGTPGVILDAITRHREDPSVRRRVERGDPFLYDEAYPDAVVVSASRLLYAWSALTGSRLVPSAVEIGRALSKLARRGRERLRMSSGDRPWAYVVPLSLLADGEDT